MNPISIYIKGGNKEFIQFSVLIDKHFIQFTWH